MKNYFLEALHFRFACKKFDITRKISDENFNLILEAGRLSPSSFGLEQTRFIVVKTPKIREEMRPLCWNQSQITDSSHLVILTSQIANLHSESDYATRMFKKRVGDDKEKLKAYKDERYNNFLEQNHYTECQNIFQWSARQAYIAASSMMNMAAFLKIDSCAIEGFEKKALESFLKIDTFKEQIALLIAFGYRDPSQSKRSSRLPLDELVRTL